MGNVAQSLEWDGLATAPTDSIRIWPKGGKTFTAFTGSANLMPGLACYLSAAPNTFIEAGAILGKTATEGFLYVVEVEAESVYQAENYVLATAYAASVSCRVFRPKVGDQFWLKGSSLTCAEQETLVTAANGLWTNVGDPDGQVGAAMAWACKALAPLTSGTWVPGEFIGMHTFDN